MIVDAGKNGLRRPRFSWNAQNVPWTDGIGDQVGYAESLFDRLTIHNNLDDNTSNKISKTTRGIVLISNLYGRARDMIRSVRQEVLDDNESTNVVVDVFFKNGPLSVNRRVSENLQLFLSSQRSKIEFS